MTVDVLNKLQSHQKINHFPGMNTLSRKNNLAKNLSRMQEGFPEIYDYFPKTFMLPSDSSLLKTYYNESKRRGRAKTYIIKPEASCQGRGIFLSQNLECIFVDISEKSKPMGSVWCRPISIAPYYTRDLNLT